MEDQARHIYKKVESDNLINVVTIKQEIEADKPDYDEDQINPYHEIFTNKVKEDNTIISQMEQWTVVNS